MLKLPSDVQVWRELDWMFDTQSSVKTRAFMWEPSERRAAGRADDDGVELLRRIHDIPRNLDALPGALDGVQGPRLVEFGGTTAACRSQLLVLSRDGASALLPRKLTLRVVPSLLRARTGGHRHARGLDPGSKNTDTSVVHRRRTIE
ncbi:hypothetical protein AURDEDRAFT_159181 [Auricularia subglabra TFB-10046 SS5]|nr:hypothetical protein AURDEDRAFT_159181 [Auricularia subglabra TFB-10046 SS5]